MLLVCCNCGLIAGEGLSNGQAVLQAAIDVVPDMPVAKDPEKMMPGSIVKIKARIKNVGSSPSAPGVLSVRFALPSPLDTQKNSVLFQTEQIAIPSLAPGMTETFAFQTPHQWPTLYDFIRYDWGLRQYQAILHVGDVEAIAGTAAITFSAYYYEGPAREVPVPVPAS